MYIPLKLWDFEIENVTIHGQTCVQPLGQLK